MLKLTLKPGEYIDIGENIRVVFSGGSANNIHLLIEAPKEVSVARSNALANKDRKQQYYTDDAISAEAQREIADILMKEKRKHEPKKVTAGMGKKVDASERKVSKRIYTAGMARKRTSK